MINFQEGSIVFNAKVNQSPNGTKFDFIVHKSGENEFSIKIENKHEFIILHKYEGINNKLIYDFLEYFDKAIHVVVTWSLKTKELKLYINGEIKKTEEMEVKTKL